MHRCARRRCAGPTFQVRGDSPAALAAAAQSVAAAAGVAAPDLDTLVVNVVIAAVRYVARVHGRRSVRARLPDAHPLRVAALARDAVSSPGEQPRVVIDATRPPAPPTAQELARAETRAARKAEKAERHAARIAATNARKQQQAEAVRAQRLARRRRLDPTGAGLVSQTERSSERLDERLDEWPVAAHHGARPHVPLVRRRPQPPAYGPA